jgi:hypothetical protein
MAKIIQGRKAIVANLLSTLGNVLLEMEAEPDASTGVHCNNSLQLFVNA